MVVIGFYLIQIYVGTYENAYHQNNYFHYKDALCMSLFLWIGDYLKRKKIMDVMTKRRCFIGICVFYFMGHLLKIIMFASGHPTAWLSPVILSHGTNINSVLQVPAYIIFVMLGSLLSFDIAKYIGKNNLLEFIGRNSLVVYGIHFLFLNAYCQLIDHYISPTSFANAFVYICILYVMTLLSSFLMIKLFTYKPFCWLIGKF